MKKTVLTLALLLAAAANAAIVDLGTLDQYANSTFMLGGIEFGSFIVQATSKGGATKVEADGIALLGEVDGDTVNLYFSGGWTAESGQSADTLINFAVVSKTPIVGNTLLLDAYGVSGTGIASISENVKVLGDPSTVVADKFVYSGTSGSVVIDQADYIPAQTQLRVIKDVYVGGGSAGIGHISGFSQSFVVPEPITLSMLALGGLVLRRRR